MKDNGPPPESMKTPGTGAPTAPSAGPTQSPLNLVTPVIVHEKWEDTYNQKDVQESGNVDYKELADGSIVISKQSLELIQRKLNAASELKKRHLKILKIHEQLLEDHENLLREREKEQPVPAPAMPPVPAAISLHGSGSLAKALTRMDKITRALARCKWHEFKRRKSLLIAMMKTLNHIKRQTLTP